MQHAIRYLHGRGARSIFLDAVPDAIPLYERLGFRKICRSLRFNGTLQGQRHPHVRGMQGSDLAAVSHLDRAAFRADRHFFVERRLSLYPQLCHVLGNNGEVAGFILGRPRLDAVTAGPWVIAPGVEHPEHLLDALAAEVPGVRLALGVLESSTAAVDLVRSLGFVEYPTPPWRMVLAAGGQDDVSNHLLAIGSPAKG